MFDKDVRVCLTEKVLHPEFRGMTGTVKRVVKSWGVVTVVCDNDKRYDALLGNLEVIQNASDESGANG